MRPATVCLLAWLPAVAVADFGASPEDVVVDAAGLPVTSPLVIRRTALAQHVGSWTYFPPEAPHVYGQYLYTSPMDKNCSANLTIHVATWMCATGYNTPAYLNEGLCIPDAYELPASIVDTINNRSDILSDTCVQLSAHHYDFTKMPLQRISEEFAEAARKWPQKHGFVTGGDGSRADKIARTAAVLGVLHLEVHAQAVVISDLSQKPTFFQTRSAANWLLPGMMEMVPERFALLVDTASAQDMVPAFQAVATQTGKRIVARAILPVFDGSDPSMTDGPTDDAIDLFLARDVRYVVLGTSTAASYAVFGCRLYLRGGDLYRRIQLLAMATPGDVLMAVPGCSADVLREVIENGGMVASVAWPPSAADDILINRASGGGYQGGGSWNLAGEPWVNDGPAATATPGVCEDDDAGAAASPTLLALLNRSAGPVACSELVAFGQASWQPYIVQVAEFCPVSSCNWNPWMPACRISCACSGGTMPSEPGIAVPGGPRCLPLAQLPADWLPSRRLRCDGAQCRRLDFGPSGWDLALRFWEYARGRPPYWHASSVREGFCSSPHFCWNIPPWAVHFGVGLGVVDGVYALAMAWACVERLHGAAALQRLAAADPGDYEPTQQVMTCMKEHVSFEGAQGRVNFRYPEHVPHSPSAGFTFANILSGTRTANNEQAVAGFHTPRSAVVASRVVSRKDYKNCTQWNIEISPGRDCPGESPQEEYRLDDPGTHDLLPLAGPAACPLGQFPLGLEDVALDPSQPLDQCRPCPAGSYKDLLGASRCTLCAAGRFASLPGADGCAACAPGRFSRAGAERCEECPVGRSTENRAGEPECLPCSPGSFLGHTGGVACELCKVGTYVEAEGQSECLSCGLGSATPQLLTTMSQLDLGDGSLEWVHIQGASSASTCGCDKGTRAVAGSCAPCEEGMRCPGMGLVEVEPGFWWAGDGPVWRCFADADRCPGGGARSCAPGRDPASLACSQCVEGTRAHADGSCEGCGAGDALPVVLLALLLVLGLSGVYVAVAREDRAKQRNSTLLIGLALSQLLTTFQTLGVFALVDFDWPSPVKEFLGALSFLALDVEILPLECMGSTSSSGRFALRVLVLVLIFVILAVIHLIATLVVFRRGCRQSFPMWLASSGTVFMALMLTIVSGMTAPLHCRRHLNGQQTMQIDDGVVCWDGSQQHGGMVALGLCACMLPLAFLGLSAWAVRELPLRLQRGESSFLHTFLFLFSRFRVECHWYVLVFMGRNLICALTPVLPWTAVQWCALAITLLANLCLTIYLLPWRASEANMLDTGMTFVLILVMGTGALMSEQQSSSALAYFTLVLMIGCLLAAVALVLRALLKRLGAHGRLYQYFISHHKAMAGNFARLLKLHLTANTGVTRQVFIDSDNLLSLHGLFGSIKDDTEHVIVVCTRDIFKRPWCVGELTTAFLHKVPVMRLALPDFQFPSAAVVDGFDKVLGGEDLALLAEHGFRVSLMQEMLRWLPSTPGKAICIDELPRLAEITAAIVQEDKMHSGKSCMSTGLSTSAHGAPTVGILADQTNLEAACTASILQFMLAAIFRTDEGMTAPGVLELDQELEPSMSTLLVVCTNGSLARPHVALTLCHAHELRARMLPVVAEAGFRFPTQPFLEDLRQDLYSSFPVNGFQSHPVGMLSAQSSPVSRKGSNAVRPVMSSGVPVAEKAVVIVVEIFKIIALEVNPQDSEAVLELRVRALARRILAGGAGDGDSIEDRVQSKLKQFSSEPAEGEQPASAAAPAAPAAAGLDRAPQDAALAGVVTLQTFFGCTVAEAAGPEPL